MVADLTSFDPVLKQHYVGKRPFDLADLNNPWLAEIPKNPRAGGKDGFIIQPLAFENPGGGSATFATALANQVAGAYEDFNIGRKKNYQLASIDNELIHAAMGDANAFVPAFDEIDRAFRQAGRRLARQLPRAGGGAIAQMDATTTITGPIAILDDPADAFNFQVGMICVFDDVNGTGTPHAGTLTVTGVDRENGEITFGANLNTIAGLAATDFIFQEGDYGLLVNGLEDWIPVDRTGLATPFLGVTRSQDEDRLAGLLRTANGEPLDESLIKGTATCSKHGARTDRAYMNPETLSDLMLLLEGKVVMDRVTIQGRGTIGFTAVRAIVGTAEVTLVGDVNHPTNRLHLLQKDTWKLHSAGDTPMFLDRDGLLLRNANADSYQVRVGGYQNKGCAAPGYNMVVDLS